MGGRERGSEGGRGEREGGERGERREGGGRGERLGSKRRSLATQLTTLEVDMYTKVATLNRHCLEPEFLSLHQNDIPSDT